MDVPSIAFHFDSLTDPRTGNAKQYELTEILIVALLATICDADDWEAIAEFGRSRLEWLRTITPLPNGIPSHDTFARVFSRLDPDALGKCFVNLINDFGDIRAQQIAIDGKCLRGTRSEADEKDAIYMVSAWACTQQLVIGQFKVQQKSNEITAIPELIDLIRIAGCTITIDAMGCQKEIAKKIISSSADYVLALKDNHPHLHEDTAMLFDWLQSHPFDERKLDFYETVDHGHGRIETRRCWTTDAVSGLDPDKKWFGLKSVVKMELTRVHKGKTSVENRYFISSRPSNAKAHLKLVRGHWGIENRLHWVLDVVFDEDGNRTRKDYAPQNLAVIRHLVLNLLRQEETCKKSLSIKRQKAGWDSDYLIKVLTSSNN